MAEEIEKSKKNYSFINKVLSSTLTIGLLVTMIGLSWIASPDPIVDVLSRSVPIIVLVASMLMIVLSGANSTVRLISSIFLFGAAIFLYFFFGYTFWAVAYLIVGLAILFDFLITIQGCKSPFVLNSSESFVIFVVMFGTAFAVGFFFELLNENVAHIWDLVDLSSIYPMISILGVDMLVVFNWAIVGILLFEAMLFVFIISRKKNDNGMKSCNLE